MYECFGQGPTLNPYIFGDMKFKMLIAAILKKTIFKHKMNLHNSVYDCFDAALGSEPLPRAREINSSGRGLLSLQNHEFSFSFRCVRVQKKHYTLYSFILYIHFAQP